MTQTITIIIDKEIDKENGKPQLQIQAVPGGIERDQQGISLMIRALKSVTDQMTMSLATMQVRAQIEAEREEEVGAGE